MRRAFTFLLVCQSYPPVIGGSEIEAQRVCTALIRRGHRVTVVCAGGPPMPNTRNWVDPDGVPVRIYAERWQGTLQNIVFALRVAAMLIAERRNYQFVYFLMQGLHLAAGLPVARMLKKPIIMKIAGSGEIPRVYKSRIGRQELAWLNRWASKILVLNEGMHQEAVNHGLLPRKLGWMPNPVDTKEFAPAKPEEERRLRCGFGIPKDAQVVMYAGRLAPEKGLCTLLEAFFLLARHNKRALLVLVGDGGMRDTLALKARQFGLADKRVLFAGRVHPHEVSQWLKIAQVFALVSPAEGFSCALAEAMSTAVPSVVSDIPANRQLIEDGVHGVLTPVGDKEKVAAAITALLEDVSLRKQMGEMARQRILENYSTEHIIDRYESLFREIVANEAAS